MTVSHNLCFLALLFCLFSAHIYAKPANITFKINKPSNDLTVGDSVVMTCKADAYPNPQYVIFFNGTRSNQTHGGNYTVNSLSLNDTGTYECIAKNMLGNVSKAIFLTVKAKEMTTVTTNKPRTHTEPSFTSSSTKNGDSSGGRSGSNHKLIVGIVVGVLGIIIGIIILVWFFCKGSNSREEAGGETDTSLPANLAENAENPDENVNRHNENEAGEDNLAGNEEDSLTDDSLDPVALQPNSSEMRVRDHEETNYATIELEQLKNTNLGLTNGTESNRS